MDNQKSNIESGEKVVLSDEMLATYVLACNAAAEMADRLKTLMEMHSRLAAGPEHMACMGTHGIINQGRSAHWWMEQLGEYFNGTDAVDSDSPMDQSWDVALDAARKFFPLANPAEENNGMVQAAHGSLSSEALGHALEIMKVGIEMSRCREKLEDKSWDLIVALTNDPRDFPKAAKIGSVDTDVATIRIDGVTSEPIEIMTGADGSYDVFADNYDEYGLPGRIIIEIHRAVRPGNESSAGTTASAPRL